MSYQAIRFAGGLRNIKGNNCAPYMGLLAQVQEHKAAVQAHSTLMTAEPAVPPVAATFQYYDK